MTALPWVATLGGPLLIIPASLAAAWRGTDPPLDERRARALATGWTYLDPPSDYDRACLDLDHTHVEEFEACGSLRVGDGRALVLDNETSTTGVVWRDGAVLLRGEEVATIADAHALLLTIAEERWRPTALTLELGDGGLLAFDAAFPGHADPAAIEADYGVLHLPLAPGRYAVHCAVRPGRGYLLRFSK
ncbi:MAG: immunity 21 family protein [Deltaproteobacteria bacterium]|nr:immunity 21 family protein [Deltaproteobacteria bacterium]